MIAHFIIGNRDHDVLQLGSFVPWQPPLGLDIILRQLGHRLVFSLVFWQHFRTVNPRGGLESDFLCHSE
jgi:hypothetical protein